MAGKIALTALVVLTYIWMLVLVGKHFGADITYELSRQYLEAGAVAQAQKYAEYSIRLNPKEPSYYRQRARVYLAQGSDKILALADLKTAHAINPKNLATLRNAVPVYYFLAISDLEKPATTQNIDGTYAKIAQAYFDTTKSYVLNDVGVQVLVAKYERELGHDVALEKTLTRIEFLRPDLLQWHPDLLK